MKVKRLNAVLIDSSDSAQLVRFYRDKLGVPLEEERHGSEPHWACFLDGVHFAVHQKRDLTGFPRNVALSFEVEDVDRTVADLRQVGVFVEMEPCARPFGRLAAVRDPDGNVVYLHRSPAEDGKR